MKDENCPYRLCKNYINKEKKSLGYTSNTFGIMVVAEQYLCAANWYKLLLFYLFNHLFLAFWWILWVLSFLYLYRNQPINFLITISWLVSVWAVSVESVRLNGYIGNIWITEISIVSLFNFFVGVFVFIINVFFSWKILL